MERNYNIGGLISLYHCSLSFLKLLKGWRFCLCLQCDFDFTVSWVDPTSNENLDDFGLFAYFIWMHFYLAKVPITTTAMALCFILVKSQKLRSFHILAGAWLLSLSLWAGVARKRFFCFSPFFVFREIQNFRFSPFFILERFREKLFSWKTFFVKNFFAKTAKMKNFFYENEKRFSTHLVVFKWPHKKSHEIQFWSKFFKKHSSEKSFSCDPWL